jgi:thiol-disulfide isomerase/thioredoxin
MMLQSLRTSLAILAMTAASFAAANSAPPSDEAVRAVAAEFSQQRSDLFSSGHASLDDIKTLYANPLGDLSLGEMTPSQIAMLHAAGVLQGVPTVAENEPKDQAVGRLTAFADDPGEQGAVACILLLELRGAATPQGHPEYELQTDLLKRALAHPQLDTAVRQHDVALLSAIASLGRIRAWKDSRDQILALQRFLDDEMPPAMAGEFGDYWRVLEHVLDDADEQDRALRQQIRAAMVKRGRAALDESAALFSESEREIIEQTLARLDGAAARGELIGHPAPALEIVWSSDPAIGSLAALHGNVVVLDFWATWCGPCIASIPNVRELQSRYAGYPVKILGVTSVQGMHVPKDGQPVETKGDPQKEFSLMSGYIEQQEITWPIVFTEQDVFNPDYGVRGIPHMAIIDPAGRVRYSGLHPADPLPEKAAKIDALLKEAQLPAPAPLPADAQEPTAGG